MKEWRRVSSCSNSAPPQQGRSLLYLWAGALRNGILSGTCGYSSVALGPLAQDALTPSRSSCSAPRSPSRESFSVTVSKLSFWNSLSTEKSLGPFLLFYWLISRERERNINLLFHLPMHTLVDSFMCPDQEWNPQLWHTGMTIQPGQGLSRSFGW